MESRFAHLRQRDSSVSMLRVRMSRRRSQAQKENRDRVVNTRRQLTALKELEMSSLDASMSLANMSVTQGRTRNAQLPKNDAEKERLKQLQRWKERKALEKEKEKREKGRKGVFKTGLYHPKDSLNIGPLPPVPIAHGGGKEVTPSFHLNTKSAASAQYTRVTRSMKQQQVQKPLKMQDINAAGKKSQPCVERTTRSRAAALKQAPSQAKTKEPATGVLSKKTTNKSSVTAAPVLESKPKDKCADVHTTISKVVEVALPPVDRKNSHDKRTVPAVIQESISKPEAEKDGHKACSSEEEEMAVEQTIANPPLPVAPNPSPKMSSFAPEGFLFQAPLGLSSFKFDPLTPRSADAFLTPSSSFTLPPVPTFDEPKTEDSKPSTPKSLSRSPRPAPTTLTNEHDVPYFRSEIANESDRLTGLCVQWESKVEDESIPEEMRDRMRTAVGQARLLMKERFNQFSGLVDDCEFDRGEKITTCTDLQGFWDMVYFQVEDVNKKFDALKEAEGRGWVEEHKPPTRMRKVVKKPAPAPAPAPSKPAGTKAAAKSRLAAAKAAMKARQLAAESEKSAQAESTEQSLQGAPSVAKSTDTEVNSGGFFQVQSPAKPPDSMRRSSRLSAMALSQQSPSSNCLTPRRMTRRSLALAQTPVPVSAKTQPTTPSLPYPVNAALSHATPVSTSLHFSPMKEMSADATEQTEDSVSDAGQSVPSIIEEQEKPAEDMRSGIDLSPHLSQSPCKSPVKSPAPIPAASLSFTLSPCAVQLSSPAVSCTPQAGQDLSTRDSLAATSDCSANEDMPGLDFERYLQPSQRDSLSPRQPFAMESPMVMDVDMESPRDQPENPLTQQEAVSTVLPCVPSLVSSQSPQTVESAMLLFTPDMKDRIRQSVCPSDLMVFTPPHL